MSLGIFVEDQDDRESLKIILNKLGQSLVHRVWVRQGDMLKVGEVSRHIKTLKGLHPEVKSVLIFLDSEGADPAATKRGTEPSEKALNKAFPRIKINYIVVDHSLEGWLCSDADALRKVLGLQSKIKFKGNPENHLHPADLLKDIFKTNNKSFIKGRDNPKIAEAMKDARIIAQKSPTFKYLLKTLGI